MRGATELLSRLNGKPLHALVNNAGISPKNTDGMRLDCLHTPLDLWQQVYQVNVFAPVMLTQQLADCLRAGAGSVVNVTSIAGGRVHEFAGSAYATSKAALGALTREMASDFGREGIRVNAIAPGEIKTDILSPQSEGSILPQIPLGRFGDPLMCGRDNLFLCSDEAKICQWREIHVNGGSMSNLERHRHVYSTPTDPQNAGNSAASRDFAYHLHPYTNPAVLVASARTSW